MGLVDVISLMGVVLSVMSALIDLTGVLSLLMGLGDVKSMMDLLFVIIIFVLSFAKVISLMVLAEVLLSHDGPCDGLCWGHLHGDRLCTYKVI